MESTKENNFISAVIYCSNNAATIGPIIEQLDQTLKQNFKQYEIIVVDDGSTDNSSSIIRQFASGKEEKVITLLNMGHPQGLEPAMNAGVDLAIGDFVLEFDTPQVDFDWSLLMQIYRRSLHGYDIVSATAKRPTPFFSQLFYALFNRYAHLQYEIQPETFRILSRRAINRIHSISQSIPYRKAAYANCGLAIDRLDYLPLCTTARPHLSDRTGLAIDSLILYTDVAYRVTVGLAFIMAIATAAFAGYALVYKLMSNPVEGWTTTIIFLAFGFFGLFIILAMVIKYLQTLVRLGFRKKEFLFESIEKLQ